mgnify:CR=1 FL=1
MEPVKMKFSELLTIGCIIVSITTAYVLLSADVTKIKDAVVKLEIDMDKIQAEQFRVRFLLDRRSQWDPTSEDVKRLNEELNKKPWRR